MSQRYTKPQTKEEKEHIKDMKHQIEVNSKSEGEAISKALGNPVTRAAVVIEGALADLSKEQQERVIRFVQESLSGADNS